MFCGKCGAQLPEGAAFCGSCGSSVEKTQKKTSVAIIGIVAAVVLVIIIAVVAILLLGKKEKNKTVNEEKIAVGEATTENGLTEVDPAEQTPLYNITDVAAIDIYAQNYTPGVKQEGIVWDSTLFYWLEDIDQTSSEDGYLSSCHISKTMLRNAESGQLIQYEIYRDPNTSEIYKIVSIEQTANGLKLTDYYYDDGKPNFAFTREDSVYTPTYATPSKTGERYYFAGDVLARWRMIRVPNEIGEYVLTPTEGGAAYSQANYFTESAEIQKYYDETEMRMLNAAYNTYNAVSAQPVGLIEGKVQDTTGAGLGNLMVDVLRKSDDVLLYRGTTAEDGSFCILTYLDNTECYIVIRGNSEYKESSIYGVFLADSGINNSYNNLLLHKVGGNEYPVHINVYSAADVRTGEDGTVTKTLLPGSKVSVRAGAGAYTGDVLVTVEADAEGKINANLQSGTYTAQIEAPGCSVSYLEIEVAEQETTVEGYVLPVMQEDKTGIVLTWDGVDIDLDLTLFTPYQSTGGDMAHIGATVADDGHGNQLVADNGAGCEVMYVNTAELGNYKLYVNNYTDSQNGNYLSDMLSRLDVHIYIYDINGFVAEYSFPSGQSGVVWEVVDISGKQITPSYRVYNQIEGKSWWMENKEALDINECKNLQVILEILTNSSATKNADALYQGDLSMARNILYEYTQLRSGTDNCPYFESIMNEENAVAAIDEYYINQGSAMSYYAEAVAYTLEQANYILASTTGQAWSIASLTDIAGDESVWRICGDYVVTDVFAYNQGEIFLENFQTDYIGGNKWVITADGMVQYPGEPKYPVVQITATVFRNPDSCFDGFSVSDFSMVEVNDTNQEAIAYYKAFWIDRCSYLVPEWVDEEYDYILDGSFYYVLRDVDSDGVVEMYATNILFTQNDSDFTGNTWLLMDYDGNGLKMEYDWYELYSSELLLDDNTFAGNWLHEAPWINENGTEYSGDLEWHSIYRYNADGSNSSLGSMAAYYNLEAVDQSGSAPGEIQIFPNVYYIDNQYVSYDQIQQWKQTNIIDKLIPESEWKVLNADNLANE